uniref:Putative methyltransferase n=1 Tax=viral metagenome TaxID=1070528 RepID=A0A6H1ZGJ0_9ZZZZ
MIRAANRPELESQFIPRDSCGVEVGVLRGQHAAWLLNNLSLKKLYLVDHWLSYYRPGPPVPARIRDKQFRRVRDRFAKDSAIGRVVILRGDSKEMASRIDDGSVDWVYVDALHTYEGCLGDLEAYRPKIRAGGLLLAHDWWATETVNKAVADYLEKYTQDELIGVVEHGDGEAAIRIGGAACSS